jgi:hypothetical protein
MRAVINDALRCLIARAIVFAGALLDAHQRLRIRRFSRTQQKLRRKSRIGADTPVVSYGPRVIESIRHAFVDAKRDARFAMTSGSTAEPKKILYTKRRLRALKFTFSDVFARTCRAYGLTRTSLYVFTSFQQDASLTSMLLKENKLPSYLSTLQAPYRVQQHAAIRALVSRYGPNAVRLWILTISNPGVLYATNPSTISNFLDEVERNWITSSRLVRDWHEHQHGFDRTVRKIARRIESCGSARRSQSIAASETPLSMEQFAPAVRACICWTGGYLGPFLDRLTKHLPPSRYRLAPMYSMSTETVETETVYRNREAHFLPLARGVVYEFIKEGDDDRPENVLTPDQLEPGQTYAMIVSDPYGLHRYQTGDLFHCRCKLDGLPDLVFLRRRALEYSFIGEKVTAEQLAAVFDQLRAQYPDTLRDGFLACVPSLPARENPHYKIILISDQPTVPRTVIAARCDELLGSINCEYRTKRTNGTLAPMRFTYARPAEFAERFAGSWETQFKFLPLYRRTWESERSDHSRVS